MHGCISKSYFVVGIFISALVLGPPIHLALSLQKKSTLFDDYLALSWVSQVHFQLDQSVSQSVLKRKTVLAKKKGRHSVKARTVAKVFRKKQNLDRRGDANGLVALESKGRMEAMHHLLKARFLMTLAMAPLTISSELYANSASESQLPSLDAQKQAVWKLQMPPSFQSEWREPFDAKQIADQLGVLEHQSLALQLKGLGGAEIERRKTQENIQENVKESKPSVILPSPLLAQSVQISSPVEGVKRAADSASESKTVLATEPAVRIQAAHPLPYQSALTPKEEPESVSEVPPVYSGYVNAFDFSVPVDGGESQMFSQESLHPDEWQRGWKISTAPYSLPSLTWVDSAQHEPEMIPLISRDSAALFLPHLAKANLKPEEGIVFGRVAAGWEVDLIGSAASAVFLDVNRVQLEPSMVDRERYFIFVNVQPGMSLVSFTSKEEAGTGAVAVPVLDGTSTYVDLTHISASRASGRVLSMKEAGQKARPVSGATVRIIGQPDLVSTTNEDGSFSFDQVFNAGRYPLYFETDWRSGYTHRHKVFADETINKTLYRIQNKEIRSWIDDLGQEWDPHNGMVVAAVPQLIDSHPDLSLIPGVRGIFSHHPSEAKVYTIFPGARLRENTGVQGLADRFLGMGVSEGPVMTEVVDHNDKRIWGELIVSSPGVINVVGPY